MRPAHIAIGVVAAIALAGGGFHGPVSLHFEYDIEGSTTEETRDRTVEAAARDLRFIRDRFTQAYA